MMAPALINFFAWLGAYHLIANTLKCHGRRIFQSGNNRGDIIEYPIIVLFSGKSIF